MALKSTIFKIALHIANKDRNYYQQHALTLAQHPSETDERLMVRLLAFALYADEALTFGKGISEDDPALWLKDLTGGVDLWIEIGQPREKTILKACGRAKKVVLIVYGTNADQWWKSNNEAFRHKTNLTVIKLSSKDTQSMAVMADRNMNITFNIEKGQILLISEDGNLNIEPVTLQSLPTGRLDRQRR